jgi:hypothetical protein
MLKLEQWMAFYFSGYCNAEISNISVIYFFFENKHICHWNLAWRIKFIHQLVMLKLHCLAATNSKALLRPNCKKWSASSHTLQNQKQNSDISKHVKPSRLQSFNKSKWWLKNWINLGKTQCEKFMHKLSSHTSKQAQRTWNSA